MKQMRITMSHNTVNKTRNSLNEENRISGSKLTEIAVSLFCPRIKYNILGKKKQKN